MSFQAAITSVFQKYVCFSGRARRSEYWYFALLNWAVSAVLTAFTRYTDSSFPSLLLSLWNIGVLLPGLGVCWRRLHDTGRSGAWFFLNLIPIVGQIILIIWLCGDSQPGWNRYGDSPKYLSGGYGGGYGQGGYGIPTDRGSMTRVPVSRTLTARTTAAATGSPDGRIIPAKQGLQQKSARQYPRLTPGVFALRPGTTEAFPGRARPDGEARREICRIPDPRFTA